MKNHIKLTIITPEKVFYSGEILSLYTSSNEGRFGILANHVPIVSILVPTITTFTELNGKELKAFTSSGVLRVHDGEVEILCSVCEWPEEIDLNRAEQAKKRAEERLYSKEDIDFKRAENAILRSLMRIKIKE